MPDLYLGATNAILPRADPGEILAERATKLFCPPHGVDRAAPPP